MAFPIMALAGLAVEFAPDIARWIGGDNAAETTEKVANVVREVTGTDDADQARQILRSNPELAAKLKIALDTADKDLEKEYLKDRQDARSRDVQIQKAKGGNWRGDALAVIAIVGLIGLIWTLLFVKIEAGPARDVLLMLSGGLVAIVKDVYGFEFGSSRGSKEKTDLMRGMKD